MGSRAMLSWGLALGGGTWETPWETGVGMSQPSCGCGDKEVCVYAQHC